MEKEAPPIINYSSFEPKKLTIGDFSIDEGQQQKLAFLSYGKKSKGCLIRLPQIELTRYGIPRESDYWKKVEDRQIIKVPLDPKQPNCMSVRKLLMSIDKVASSNEVRKRLFGDKEKSYKYVSLIKEPVDPSMYNTKDSKDIKKGPEYFKLKFDTNYPDIKKIKTQLYIKGEDNDEPKVSEAGLAEYEKYITPRSIVKMIIQPYKLWAARVPKERGLKIDYGLGLKVCQIVVKPGEVSEKDQLYRGGKSLVDIGSDTDTSGDSDSDSDSE